MRLYTRTGATALNDPEFGHFEADEQGGFDLPEDLALRLHSFHVNKQPMWETDIERQHRTKSEDLERRKDPSTLLDAVEQILSVAATATAHVAKSEPATTAPAPAKTTRARKAAAK